MLRILVLIILTSQVAFAADTLPLLRRWVVFPFDSESTLKGAADTAWLKSREKLTEKKRFLIASRQFLIQKEVYQPRKLLTPEDSRILAERLEADVLVTGFNEARKFTLNVYLPSGRLIWTKTYSFHPSLKATDQLELASDKLTGELIAAIPYQGFTLVDPLIGKPVYEEGEKNFAVVDLGKADDIAPGSYLQWLEVFLPETESKTSQFSDSKVAIVGEGKVASIKNGVAVTEVLRARSLDSIKERTLVRIPSEAQRLNQGQGDGFGSTDKLAPELLPTEIQPLPTQTTKAKGPSFLVGSGLGLILLILLAL